jgi:acetylornithine deacetylase/succinyl-diaminopimelate desuccinylase-like protein
VAGGRRHDDDAAVETQQRLAGPGCDLRGGGRRGGVDGTGNRALDRGALEGYRIEKVALWDPPMRFNDTTRTYFEKLAAIGTREEAERLNGLFNPATAAASREYLAEHNPGQYSMLHTSISPNIISGGFQVNVIPSQAEATLDIRSLPDENMPAFYDMMRKVINDPSVEVIPDGKNARPGAAPSRIDSQVYHAIEAANRKVYQIPTIPTLGTGASDMAFLRAKGMQCYGVGPAVDDEDAPLGFASHSDQERMREDSLYKFMEFQWDVLTSVAMSKK